MFEYKREHKKRLITLEEVSKQLKEAYDTEPEPEVDRVIWKEFIDRFPGFRDRIDIPSALFKIKDLFLK